MSAPPLLYVAQSFEIEFKEFLSPTPYVASCRRVWRDLLAIQARANGKAVWLLLDTGAPSTTFTAKAWKRLGLPRTGAAQVAVECGALSLPVTAGAMAEDAEANLAALEIDVDGILGLDALSGCGLGLDLASDVVALFPAETDFGRRQRIWFGSMAVEGPRGTTWIPWSSNPARVPFDRGITMTGLIPRAGISLVDSSVIDGRCCLPATIAGVTIDCVLDTASATTILPSKPFENLLAMEHDTPGRVSTAKVDSILSSGFDLAGGSEVAVQVAQGGNGHSLGTLGMNVLELSKVLIDFRENKVALTPYVLPTPETNDRRHYKAVIFDPKEKRILHFQGKARYAIHVDSVVLSGHSRIKVLSAKDEMVTIDVS